MVFTPLYKGIKRQLVNKSESILLQMGFNVTVTSPNFFTSILYYDFAFLAAGSDPTLESTSKVAS